MRDVAPFTGAWIEMGNVSVNKRSAYGRPLHGGVD